MGFELLPGAGRPLIGLMSASRWMGMTAARAAWPINSVVRNGLVNILMPKALVVIQRVELKSLVRDWIFGIGWGSREGKTKRLIAGGIPGDGSRNKARKPGVFVRTTSFLSSSLFVD